MTPQDTKTFTSLLVGSAEACGKGALSPAAIRIWFEALKAYPIEVLEEAFAREIANPDRKKFFPDPADIVRQVEGTSAEKAIAAWNVVSKCNCDAYETVIFEDPIIHQVIQDMGGWISFNDPAKWGRYSDGEKQYGYTDQQFNFFRKEFLDRYTALLKTGAPNAPVKLVGIIEFDNRDNFPEHVPEPVRISHDGRKLLPEIRPKYILEDQSSDDGPPPNPEEVKRLIQDMSKKLNSSEPF